MAGRNAFGSLAKQTEAYARRAAKLSRDLNIFALEIADEAPTADPLRCDTRDRIVEDLCRMSDVLRKAEGGLRIISDDLEE